MKKRKFSLARLCALLSLSVGMLIFVSNLDAQLVKPGDSGDCELCCWQSCHLHTNSQMCQIGATGDPCDNLTGCS